MSTQDAIGDEERKKIKYHFDRHAPDYRERFEDITHEMHAKCPIAWTDTHGGHWVAAGNREVFELAARSAEFLSNDHDVNNERRGYQGISIPAPARGKGRRGGFLEMDPPEQRYYRQALNPYLSPAAISRWIPWIDELVRACIDDRIESGRIDFVEDLVNIVPAAFTLAMMGIPIKDWTVYCEPAHAAIYTPLDSPDIERVGQLHMQMGMELFKQFAHIKENPRPGLVNALINADINGQKAPDMELMGVLGLLIGGGFDTTTALSSHAIEWLSENPAERERLSRERDTLLDSATEEFLRFYTPAVGDGRTISADCEVAGVRFKEGDRLWLSWAMANRDPAVFEEPDQVKMDREGNRHASFGLGIHRCIGSNVARTLFKRMILQVLDRMPDYVCDPEGTVHYDTISVINGMRYLPATFTPGPRLGPGLEETLGKLQKVCDEQRLAEPVTVRKKRAEIAG
ncbi:cytochrome P450 [Actinocorallia populi]|uniref:cytochrome P450 n=1 Tax=Actinocorallia populi TaxID=2079200 RepID=UPI000D089495|nr:cytochrome P450 [Actinocorallia populi]